jgi:uncharacterized protein YkwD
MLSSIQNTFRHLFVPHEQNNFRARALHLDFLTYYLVLALVLTFSFRFLQTPLNNVLGFATDISVDKLFQLTNTQRINHGLNPLTYNQQLSQAAAAKAQDMFGKNYWAHFGPSGETPWNFILSSGYKYEYAGENLAKNFLFSDGVVDAWMNSPSHRENILRSQYTDVGYAVVNGTLNGEETTLVVQMFGKPRASLAAVTTPKKEIPEPAVVKEPEVEKPQVLQKAVVNMNPSPTQIMQTIDIPTISKYLTFTALGFVLALLLLDVWYSSRKGIVKLTGHSFAHIIFLLFVFAGIVWTMSPGRIM